MRRKKNEEKEQPNEFEQAEQEAIENPEAEAELEASLPDATPTEDAAETDVKRPTLSGKAKPKKKTDFEQPADNNMSREVIGESDEQE